MHMHMHMHLHMHMHMHMHMRKRKRKMPQVAATALPSSPGWPATVCLSLAAQYICIISASASVKCTTASVSHRWRRGCATCLLRRRAPCARRSGGTSVASSGGAPKGSRMSSPSPRSANASPRSASSPRTARGRDITSAIRSDNMIGFHALHGLSSIFYYRDRYCTDIHKSQEGNAR